MSSIRHLRRHVERHQSHRLGWLRAAVLGANDGIVSTASLLAGVAAAAASRDNLLLTGIAGLVAGAMSMAAGEYVSVRSQADTEAADLARERAEIETDPVAEHRELSAIYVGRGLEPSLAREVATQLMRHDALGAHARDELGLNELTAARPLQAASASAASFAAGAAVPLLLAAFTPDVAVLPALTIGSLLSLAVLGALAAQAGGAPMAPAAGRVAMWGAIAMAVTAGIGRLVGTAV